MASNVFSQYLGTLSADEFGLSHLGPPPAGFIWVVTDMDAYRAGVPGKGAAGFVVSSDAGGIFFALSGLQTLMNVSYPWRGRQVIEAGDIFRLQAQPFSWVIRVSGYQLSTP